MSGWSFVWLERVVRCVMSCDDMMALAVVAR